MAETPSSSARSTRNSTNGGAEVNKSSKKLVFGGLGGLGGISKKKSNNQSQKSAAADASQQDFDNE